MDAQVRLLRLPQVMDMVGLRATAIYEKIKVGQFPRQVKIGKTSAWVEPEVRDWIARLIENRRAA